MNTKNNRKKILCYKARLNMTPLKKCKLTEMINAMKFVWNDYIDERYKYDNYFENFEPPYEQYLKALEEKLDASVSDKICQLLCLTEETVEHIVKSAEKVFVANMMKKLDSGNIPYKDVIRKYKKEDRITCIHIPANKIEFMGGRTINIPGLDDMVGTMDRQYYKFWRFMTNQQKDITKNEYIATTAKLFINSVDMEDVVIAIYPTRNNKYEGGDVCNTYHPNQIVFD